LRLDGKRRAEKAARDHPKERPPLHHWHHPWRSLTEAMRMSRKPPAGPAPLPIVTQSLRSAPLDEPRDRTSR
jgi:hypothetical protein